jgi:hypothetical protein
MSGNKTHFIVEEIFKSDEKELRLTTLQNAFIKLIRTCELIDNTSIVDTSIHTKENSHE